MGFLEDWVMPEGTLSERLGAPDDLGVGVGEDPPCIGAELAGESEEVARPGLVGSWELVGAPGRVF